MIELSPEVTAKLLGRLAVLLKRFEEVERMLSDPAIAGDSGRYTELAKEHGSLRRLAEKNRELRAAQARRAEAEELLGEAADAELRQLAEDEIREAGEGEHHAMAEIADMLLADEQDQTQEVIVEIRSGTGGEEAALFAADLFRMYSRYGQRRGWQIEILDKSVSERGGFKEIIFSLTGPDTWKKLRFESGGHRVQRVPVTESQGRIHTSLATVAVLPQAEEVDVSIRPEDLEISFLRSQGPGGQNVNKVSSAVRILHKPTGIIVKCQEQPSQHKNRRLALKILAARLYEEQMSRRKQERNEMRRLQVGTGDRNERIRTYNFPQDRITDHRIGLDVFGIQTVLEGDCDRIFDGLQEWDMRERIEALAQA